VGLLYLFFVIAPFSGTILSVMAIIFTTTTSKQEQYGLDKKAARGKTLGITGRLPDH
jgi:hypothetical protein